jgi:hypothetical protein
MNNFVFMKICKQQVRLRFIAIIAVIGFNFMACANGSAGSGGTRDKNVESNDKAESNKREISTLFKFSSNDLSESKKIASRSLAMKSGTTVDEESLSYYNAFYDSLGKKVRSITPTEFSLGLQGIHMYDLEKFNNDGHDYWIPLFDSGVYEYDSSKGTQLPVVDFAKATVFTPPNGIEEGFTINSVLCNFILSHLGSKITFTMPDEDGLEYHLFMISTPDATTHNEVQERNGNVVSILPLWIAPDCDLFYNRLHPDFLFYDGTVHKLGTMHDLFESDNTPYEKFLIPMNKVVIPSGAKSVTFTVNWDLTDIIEQYQGDDKIDNTADDVFVLARDFWTRLNISAVVE